MKQYGYHHWQGCVVERRSRLTGHLYAVLHAEQGWFDATAGPWVTVCEDHHTVMNHRTLKMALFHLPSGGWCEECMAEIAADELTDHP